LAPSLPNQNQMRSCVFTIFSLGLGLLVASCGNTEYRPFKYIPADDVKPGPGLLTGESGELSWGMGGKVPESWQKQTLPTQYDLKKEREQSKGLE